MCACGVLPAGEPWFKNETCLAGERNTLGGAFEVLKSIGATSTAVRGRDAKPGHGAPVPDSIYIFYQNARCSISFYDMDRRRSGYCTYSEYCIRFMKTNQTMEEERSTFPQLSRVQKVITCVISESAKRSKETHPILIHSL
jgi:hypothetical protein